jgi:hypothetical protein
VAHFGSDSSQRRYLPLIEETGLAGLQGATNTNRDDQCTWFGCGYQPIRLDRDTLNAPATTWGNKLPPIPKIPAPCLLFSTVSICCYRCSNTQAKAPNLFKVPNDDRQRSAKRDNERIVRHTSLSNTFENTLLMLLLLLLLLHHHHQNSLQQNPWLATSTPLLSSSVVSNNPPHMIEQAKTAKTITTVTAWPTRHSFST